MEETIGYARVSTGDQSTDSQTDALRAAGCTRIYTDVASGMKAARPQLAAMLDYAREGDTIVVWGLDRLGRSPIELLTLVRDLATRGIRLRSLNETIDTTTADGQLSLGITAVVAQHERNRISERTKAGLVAAKARGRKGGRPRVMDEHKIAAAIALHQAGQLTLAQIAAQLGVSRSTIAATIKKAKAE
jgi:DNA invertase Pin-like site-specific DNA recombinase